MPPVAEHGPPPDAMAVDQAVNRLGSGVRNMSVMENGAYGRPPVPPGTQAHLQAQQQAQLSQQQQQQQQQQHGQPLASMPQAAVPMGGHPAQVSFTLLLRLQSLPFAGVLHP